MPLTKDEIGQLLSDQVFSFATRKSALIEADPFDDEDGHGFDPLDRWGDRRFALKPRDWQHPDEL